MLQMVAAMLMTQLAPTGCMGLILVFFQGARSNAKHMISIGTLFFTSPCFKA